MEILLRDLAEALSRPCRHQNLSLSLMGTSRIMDRRHLTLSDFTLSDFTVTYLAAGPKRPDLEIVTATRLSRTRRSHDKFCS
jgi:hypothetical protein